MSHAAFVSSCQSRCRRTVLEDIDQQGIQTITCLGDLVGYGPQPNEVVNLIREREIISCQAVGMKTSLMVSMHANVATPHNSLNDEASSAPLDS